MMLLAVALICHLFAFGCRSLCAVLGLCFRIYEIPLGLVMALFLVVGLIVVLVFVFHLYFLSRYVP